MKVSGKVVPLSFQKLCLHMPGIRKKFERRNSPLEYYYMTYIGKTKTYNLRGL